MVVALNECGDGRECRPQAARSRLTIRPISPAVIGRIVNFFVFLIIVVTNGDLAGLAAFVVKMQTVLVSAVLKVFDPQPLTPHQP